MENMVVLLHCVDHLQCALFLRRWFFKDDFIGKCPQLYFTYVSQEVAPSNLVPASNCIVTCMRALVHLEGTLRSLSGTPPPGPLPW